MITLKFVESLGWKYNCLWNNREFYSIEHFNILNHINDWFIVLDDDLYHLKITSADMLVEYTNLIKTFLNIKHNPDIFTLKQYIAAENNIKDFFQKYEVNNDENNLNMFDLINS